MIRKIKQKKGYILAFFIPLFLFLFLYFALGFFFPNGKTIFTCDLEAQYKALYMHFRNHLFSTYSFSKGIGGSMIGTYAYYLASPFLFLLFLFPVSQLYLATVLIVTLKLCTAGFTMYTFLRHHFGDKKYLFIFSTSYVFMSYVGAYFFHIMWMDAIYMLPLVMLGIDKIMEKKKPFFYIFCLFYTILVNYYMGYIVCIFALLYFFYRLYLCEENKKYKKKCLSLFFVSSLLGGLCTSFLILPTALELSSSVRTSATFFSSLSFTPFLKVLSSLFLGSHHYATILSEGRYHIYIGIFSFLLVFLYFCNPTISKKKKKASLFFLLIFLFSIFINYIDAIWCAFSITSSFSGRYMFVFNFFLLFLAVSSFDSIQSIEKKHLYFIAPIYPILAILVLWKQFAFVKVPLVFVSVFLSFLYLLLLYCYIENKKKILFLLSFLVFAELFSNMYFMVEDFKFQYKKGSVGVYEKVKNQVSSIQKKDSSFYRIEKNFNLSMNDSLYLDYNGIQVFLSTIAEDQYSFFARSGYSVYGNIIEYTRSMPPLDSLLGVRYLFTRDKDFPYYEKKSSFPLSLYDNLFYNLVMQDVYIYENPYALGLGTVFSKRDSICFSSFDNGDRLAYQNEIFSCLYGDEVNIYEKIPLKAISSQKYILKKEKKYNVYFYPNVISSFLPEGDSIEFFIDGKSAGDFSSNGFVVQAFMNGDTDVEFTIELKGKNADQYVPYAYYFREDIYEDVFSKLGQNQMKVLENKGNYLKGKVTVEDSSFLFTTISYDPGFSVYVDGKKVDYEKMFGTFLSIPIPKGEHIIEFKYIPRGLYTGIFISVCSFLFLLFYRKRVNNI